MPTYLIKKAINITRQEGDSADISFVVPEILNLALYDAKFNVTTKLRNVILYKSSLDGTIAINGQTVTIPLLPDDTKHKTGNYLWELELSNENENITIGKGSFFIISEIIR